MSNHPQSIPDLIAASQYAVTRAGGVSKITPEAAAAMGNLDLTTLRDVYAMLSEVAFDTHNAAVRADADATIEVLDHEIDDRHAAQNQREQEQTRLPFVWGLAGKASPLSPVQRIVNEYLIPNR